MRSAASDTDTVGGRARTALLLFVPSDRPTVDAAQLADRRPSARRHRCCPGRRRCRSSVHIFSVSVARTPGAPPTLLSGETRRPAYWACRATRSGNGNGVYGTAGTDTVFTETVTENGYGNGNVMLETRCYPSLQTRILIRRHRPPPGPQQLQPRHASVAADDRLATPTLTAANHVSQEIRVSDSMAINTQLLFTRNR